MIVNDLSVQTLSGIENMSSFSELNMIEQRISGEVESADGTIRDMCAHIASSGGKRIRPQLVLDCGRAFSPINTRMINAAVASEFIHMASLVHDDIIDQSVLRRKKPSVNKLWGNHAAVLCGDWLFAKAFSLLSRSGMGKCMSAMVDAIQAMCHGEMIQAMNLYNLEMNIDTYCDLIAMKTGRLLESCCKSGAAAGGAIPRAAADLGRFGLNIGLAFQIIDDILDFNGDAAKMGKPQGEDLRQGVITLPVILLLRHERYGRDAKRTLADGSFNEAAVDTVKEMLHASGAIRNAYDIAWSFIDKAQVNLALLPDSESKVKLGEMASILRHREY